MKRLWMLIAVLVVTGCVADDPEAVGFSLPAGDSQSGAMVYRSLQCMACHTIDGIDQEPVEYYSDLSVPLGGEVTRIKTYGDLITSVINPSHRIATVDPQSVVDEMGDSRMPVYNDIMTVRQLVDLLEFLKSKYRLKPQPDLKYRMYFPAL